MSPELETLDQLAGGNLPLAVIRELYPNADRFLHGLLAVLVTGEVRLVPADGGEVPAWRWREVLAAPENEPGVWVSLTPAGIRRIS